MVSSWTATDLTALGTWEEGNVPVLLNDFVFVFYALLNHLNQLFLLIIISIS